MSPGLQIMKLNGTDRSLGRSIDINQIVTKVVYLFLVVHTVIMKLQTLKLHGYRFYMNYVSNVLSLM
jgi:hypothetical protein